MLQIFFLPLHRLIIYPFYGVGNNRLIFMKFAFIPLHRGKLMFGFTRTIVEFDSLAQARSYAKDMKADYSIYGCTSVRIELLGK